MIYSDDAPTLAEANAGVAMCSCVVGPFGLEVCDECEYSCEDGVVDEPIDLYAGDANVQEYGDGW